MWKFIMNETRFRFFENISFNTIGIELDVPSGENIITQRVKFTVIYVLSIVVAYSIFGNFVDNIGDMTKMFDGMDIFMQWGLVTAKLFLFLVKGREAAILIKQIESFYKKNDVKDFHEIALNEHRPKQIITSVYFILGWAAAFVYTSIPIIVLVVTSINGAPRYMLPYAAKLLYDYTNPILFAMTFVFWACFVAFVLCGDIGVDCLFGWFVVNISVHFKILEKRFHRIAHNLRTKESRVGYYKNFQLEFINMVDYHCQINKFVKEFNAIYALVILSEVTFSCLQICLLFYQLIGRTGDLWKLAPQAIALSTMIVQLMVFCFGGEKIRTESNNICENIYLLMPWESMNRQEKQSLRMALFYSQRSLRLSGYFFIADRSLLGYIFNTGISFNALLLALKEKDGRK